MVQMGGDSKQSAQVVYSAMSVGARLAASLRMSLKEVKRLSELAYYHEGRRRHLKLREIAALMGVSDPKVSLLSRQFKAHFSAPETEHGLPRQILWLLWAEPMTRHGMGLALGDFLDDEIDRAIEALVGEDRIEEVQGRTLRYQVKRSSHRMVEDRWLARLDGLQQMMASVASTIEGRFFRDDGRAFARSIKVDVLPEDLPRLKAFYEDQLFALLSELNERAGRSEGALTINVSILWSPDGERAQDQRSNRGEDDGEDD